MSRLDGPLPTRTLAAFLEGEVTPSEAAQIDARLRECAISRRRLERLGELRQALSDPPAAVHRVDLVAGLRAAIASAPSLSRRPLRRRVWAFPGVLALAALVAVLTLSYRRTTREQLASVQAPHLGEVAKSNPAGSGAIDPDRWVHIEVFVARDGRIARPVSNGDTVQPRDRLAFRYVNLGGDPFAYLMVLGIDAAHHVHWYYPAYEDAASAPSSIAIESRGAAVSLPDAVRHDLATGPLILYGVFTRERLRVLDIEERIAALIARSGPDPTALPRLPIAGSGQDRLQLNVAP